MTLLTKPDFSLPPQCCSVGVLGAGAFARFILSAYREFLPQFPVQAIASRTMAHAEEVADEFDIPRVTEPDELFADDELDALLIVTPPTTHYRLGLRALQAGKHLLLDKPLAFTTAEVDDLIRTANAGDLILSTNLVLRVHPVHRYIRTLVREKTFGDLLQISSTALLGKYPDDHWYWDELRSGGFFLNTFSHFLDLFDFVSGEVPVEQVTNGNPLNGYQLFGVYSSGVQFSLSASLQVDGLAEHVMTHYIFERAVISTTGWVPETMKIVDVESGNHFWTDANRDSAYRRALAAIQADFQRQIRYGVRSAYELTPLTLRNSVHIPKLFESALPSVESEADDVTGTFSENGLA